MLGLAWRPARGRPAQRRARAPAAPAHRRGRLHGRLAAVRRRSDRLAAARLPPRAGPAGAAGIVIARAIVRDLHDGGWTPRASSPCSCSSAAWRRSSLPRRRRSCCTSPTGAGSSSCSPPSARRCSSPRGRCRRDARAGHRHGGGLPATLHVFGGLVRDRAFMGYRAMGLASARWPPTSPGSPFVLQDIYGTSPQLFSVIFASTPSASSPPARSAGRSSTASVRATLLSAGRR